MEFSFILDKTRFSSVRCKSSMAIFARRVALNYALEITLYSPFEQL